MTREKSGGRHWPLPESAAPGLVFEAELLASQRPEFDLGLKGRCLQTKLWGCRADAACVLNPAGVQSLSRGQSS